MTPVIGITALVRAVDGQDRTGVNAAYARAVAAGGGTPVILPPFTAPDAIPTLLDRLDGLVLSGGADVDPSYYGSPPHPRLGALEPERDRFELALVRAARDRALPVLAICRGCQVTNVALGGTLWQDLPTERPGTIVHDGAWPRTERVHPVAVEGTSRLAEIVDTARLDVNSLHHQGVRVLAPGLRASGHSPDGLVEAFESADGSWLIGVQWHPEAFVGNGDARDLRLFDALVTAARRHR